MLTEEQLLKAKIALAKKNNEDTDKILALEWHKKSKQAFTEYGLPYRVYFDYLKNRYKHPRETVPINPCYPLPGFPIDKVIRVTPKDFRTPKELPAGSSQDDIYTYENLNEEKKFAVYMLIKQSRPWEFLNDKWKNAFSMFLVGYDFMKFSEFDFMGEVGILNRGELKLLRNHYSNAVMGRFKEYKDNGEYLLEEPAYQTEYQYLYSDKPFVVILEKDEIKDRVAVEKKLRIPPDEGQRKLYKDMYGIDIYEE